MPVSASNSDSYTDLRRQQQALEAAGAVVAELACGDVMRADRAAAEAMRGLWASPDIAGHALTLRFWRALLESALLGVPERLLLPAPFQAMTELPAGLRVLALLQLASGLGVIELAAIVQRPPEVVRRALAGVRRHVGEDAWSAWTDALKTRVHTLPTARRIGIADMRARPSRGPQWLAATRERPAWARPAMLTVAVLCAVLLAATWLLPRDGWLDLAEGEVRSRGLGPAAEPATRMDAATALAGHPDRVLLEIPEADAAIARDSAFYAWYQAERLGVAEYEPPPPEHEAPETGSSDVEAQGSDAGR
ncbi:hypothetical protein [Luteimonas sp. e5]